MKSLKISWGYRIAILYLSFVALICFMIFMAMRQRVDLVSDDYYAKELVFQDRIDAANNAVTLPGRITHVFSGNALTLQFPECFREKTLTGEVGFFRPAGSEGDYKCNLSLNPDLSQEIDATHLMKGMYHMQIAWTAGSVPYFFEQVIVVP